MRQIKFPFSAPSNGLHEIKVSYPTSGNRAGNIRYEVMHEDGLSKVLLDQASHILAMIPGVHLVLLPLRKARVTR